MGANFSSIGICFSRNLKFIAAPVMGIGQGAPLVHLQPQRIDGGRVGVLLLLGREPCVEEQGRLTAPALFLPGLGDRGDEFGAAPGLQDPLRRLPGAIQFPVTVGIRIRRIEDRLREEGVIHFSVFCCMVLVRYWAVQSWNNRPFLVRA